MDVRRSVRAAVTGADIGSQSSEAYQDGGFMDRMGAYNAVLERQGAGDRNAAVMAYALSS